MHPDVQTLASQFHSFSIKIKKKENSHDNDLFWINLSVKNKSWVILIDDEYQHFSKENKLINWFLVLRSLDLYKEAKDILEWSNEFNINPSDYLNYYRSLDGICKEIESKVGKIDPVISHFDYQLGAGATQELLQH